MAKGGSIPWIRFVRRSFFPSANSKQWNIYHVLFNNFSQWKSPAKTWTERYEIFLYILIHLEPQPRKGISQNILWCFWYKPDPILLQYSPFKTRPFTLWPGQTNQLTSSKFIGFSLWSLTLNFKDKDFRFKIILTIFFSTKQRGIWNCRGPMAIQLERASLRPFLRMILF